MVFNYNYQFAGMHDASTNEAVLPQFTNLPFNGAVSVERYVIDATTSNLELFIDSGRPLRLQRDHAHLCRTMCSNGRSWCCRSSAVLI